MSERNLKKVLLVHGLDSMDLAKLEILGHKMILIDGKNGGGKIKEILAGESIPAKIELPEEKVVIFNGYENKELQEGVGKIRASFEERPIIATVTDNSYEWPFEFLLTEHLMADRDWNMKNGKEYMENLKKENAEMEAKKKASNKES